MNRLIIDITERYHWQGNLTGVPRVIDKLAKRFETSQEVVMVVWDGETHTYQQTDEISPINHSVRQSSTEAASATKPLVLRKYLPGGIRRRLSPLARIAGKAARFIKVLHRAQNQQNKPISATSVKTEFVLAPTDTLFVFADWHGSDPAFVDYLVRQKHQGIRLIQICYDMLPLVTPQFSGHATKTLKNYCQKIYPLCDIIFAISKHTKSDIQKWLTHNNLKVPRIEVFRLGDDFVVAKPEKPSEEIFRAEQPFILCVGSIEIRKNHNLLYYAYKLALQRGIDLPNLVIVGRRGWKTDDLFELINNDPDIVKKFCVLENATDQELTWLYKNSIFSIYPSFYEGWGLPIAESIAHGTPCIASNTSSMPEVAGDIISYFDPYSTDECLEAITNMLKPAVRNNARKKLTAYKPVSWDETFSQIKKTMEQDVG